MSIGNFPDNLSQAMLVGIMLVGRLGVDGRVAASRSRNPEIEGPDPSRSLPPGGGIPPVKVKPPDFSTRGFLVHESLRPCLY